MKKRIKRVPELKEHELLINWVFYEGISQEFKEDIKDSMIWSHTSPFNKTQIHNPPIVEEKR